MMLWLWLWLWLRAVMRMIAYGLIVYGLFCFPLTALRDDSTSALILLMQQG